MRRPFIPLVCLLAMLAAWPALAKTAPAQRAAAIAPFLDDQTVAVAYVDLDAVDPDALAAELERAGVPKEITTQPADELKKGLARLRGAGIHDLYVVMSTAYLLDVPAALVAPLPPGTDAAAAVAALGQRHERPAAAIGGAVVAAPQRVLDMIRQKKPVPRPELGAAFAAAGDAPVVLALIPTADNRRAIEETLPVLPERFGGGASSVLTRGVTWASVALRVPPQMALDVTVRSADAQAAQALADKLVGFRHALEQRPEAQAYPQAVKAFVALSAPKVQADGLLLHLDADQIGLVVGQLAMPALLSARDHAAISSSQSNMHQMLVAVMMYKGANKDWPDNLQQILGPYLQDKAVLKDPRRPDLDVGYEYRKPAKDAPPQTAIVWEKFDKWPDGGVNVGYIDAAVQFVRDQDQFKKVLEKGR